MMEVPANRERMYWPDVDLKTDDGMALEALVSAAMVLASHIGGLGGVAFPGFLGVLLYQLGVTTTDEPMELPGIAGVVVPFFSPPNVDWQSLGVRLDNFYRTVSQDRIDFRIESAVMSGECKDYSDGPMIDVIKGILECIPDDSRFHIVVTRTLEDLYLNEEELLEWNGLEHTEFYRVLGPQRFERVSTLRT